MFAVSSKVSANTITELVALAKSQPGKLTYGSSGLGGVQQLTVEMLRQRADLDLLHVPYKGGGQMVIAVISGLIAGRIISLTGRRIEPYLDKEEFLTEQAVESALR